MPIRASEDVAIAHRHPAIVISDAYLNDPITFAGDRRFDPDSILREAGNYPIAERDLAEYIEVDLGVNSPQLYAAEMYTPTYSRQNFAIVMNNA